MQNLAHPSAYPDVRTGVERDIVSVGEIMNLELGQ